MRPRKHIEPSDVIAICDTREQTPIHFARGSVKQTLTVGDYALAAPHDLGIRIERKSLSDFAGTMSGRKVERTGKRGGVTEDSAFERFDRELARAAEANLHVVMLVEATLSDALGFDHIPHLRRFIRASASYVFKQLRLLLTKHPLTFQCAFVDGPEAMERATLRVFELGAQARTTDIQYAIERKLI